MTPTHSLIVLFFFVALIPAWLAFQRYRTGKPGQGLFVGILVGLIVAGLITFAWGWIWNF
jgi:membrane-bound metal-dependent hydrolase YbcI (DUF457 family)